MPKPDFLRAWCAVAYAFPGLHPDGYEDEGSGWPRVLRRFAAEAGRRAGAGELSDEELYPGDAQWAGLYDRMLEREDDETGRRFQIAADHGAGGFLNHRKARKGGKGLADGAANFCCSWFQFLRSDFDKSALTAQRPPIFSGGGWNHGLTGRL